MISVALPYIQRDFQLSYTHVSWLISSFYLASAIAQPVMGKIGDQIGRKRLFLLGIVGVAAAVTAAPFAAAFWMLLFCRVLQAIGSSTLFPSGTALIQRHVRKNRASVMALLAICNSAAAAFGPTIGGFLVSRWDWPAIFTVNFPVLLFSFICAWFFLPADSPEEGASAAGVWRKLDIPGLLLFAFLIGFLLWFLLELASGFQPLIGFLGLLCLIGFVWRERRTQEPFIDVRYFCRNTALSTVLALFVMMNIFFYALFFGLPTYFDGAMRLDAQQDGLIMLFLSGFSVIASLVAGKWADRSGIGRPLLVGSLSMLAASLLLMTVFAHTSLYGIMGILVVMGAAYGFLNVTLQAAMLQFTPQAMVGLSSGLFQTSRYLGSILSSVVLGWVFGREISGAQMQMLGIILTILSGVVCIVSLQLRRKIH